MISNSSENNKSSLSPRFGRTHTNYANANPEQSTGHVEYLAGLFNAICALLWMCNGVVLTGTLMLHMKIERERPG